MKIQVIPSGNPPIVPRTKEIVVAAAPATGAAIQQSLAAISQNVVGTSSDTATFAAAGDGSKGVVVVVVDLDQYSLSFLHDMHTVFPYVRLVAISKDPAKLAKAVPAGASLALPSTTPSPQLAALIARLAAGGYGF